MNQATEKDNRDQQIGRSIASAIQQQQAAPACLSDEQLASLMDNRLPSGERERCLAHIAACNSCLARYSMAATLLQPQNKSIGQRWYGYGAALTAVAAALIAVIVTRQQPPQNQLAQTPQLHINGQPAIPSKQPALKPYDGTPTFAQPTQPASDKKEPLSALALASQAYNILAANPISSKTQNVSYGFAGGLAPTKSAFRSGVAVVHLAVALKSDNRQQTEEIMDQICTLLGVASDHPEIGKLLEVKPLDKRKAYTNLVTWLEQQAKATNQSLLFRLGIWVETGRITENNKLVSHLDYATLKFLVRHLNDDQAPQGVRRILEQLEKRLGSPLVSENEYRAVRYMLDTLIELY